MARTVSARTPDRPRAVALSMGLWYLALAAGAFETLLVVVSGDVTGAGLLAGVAVRLAVFAAMALVVGGLGRGRTWARWVLAVVLGLLGSLSLVVGPVQWLLAGHGLGDLVDAADADSILFAASRTIHVAAVWTATWWMFSPPARPWFPPTMTDGR